MENISNSESQKEPFEKTKERLTREFKKLNNYEVMKLPWSMLTPTEINYGANSYSREAPLRVYMREYPPIDKHSRGDTKFFIENGNTEFFQVQREAYMEKEDPNFDEILLDIQKFPDPKKGW